MEAGAIGLRRIGLFDSKGPHSASRGRSLCRPWGLEREKNPKLAFSGCWCANPRNPAKRIRGKNAAFTSRPGRATMVDTSPSRWMCRTELEAGELVAILSDHQLDWVELHAVYPGDRRPSLKVRVVSDYFAAQLTQPTSGDARGAFGLWRD
jgi:DNA-binding transcriptional LysR family regulator